MEGAIPEVMQIVRLVKRIAASDSSSTAAGFKVTLAENAAAPETPAAVSKVAVENWILRNRTRRKANTPSTPFKQGRFLIAVWK